MPSNPATSARSVPWPWPVAAKEPESAMFAVFGVPSPSSLRAMRPMRTAPAVCEELGPTITGPRISNRFMKHSPLCVLYDKDDSRNRPRIQGFPLYEKAP